MRYEQGRWSEERIIEAINNTTEFRAVPYGRSRVLITTDRAKIEEYWRKYTEVEKYGKRPNIIVFKKDYYDKIKNMLSEDPTLMSEEEWGPLIKQSVCGIEAENSLWRASKMPDKDLKLPLPRINLIAPNIWVKKEDVERLLEWQAVYNKPIYIVQVFYDLAYAARLRTICEKAQRIYSYKERRLKIKAMKREGLIITKQKYTNSRTGISQEKVVYRLHPAAAILFGRVTREPSLKTEVLEDERGKILPYVHFIGGSLTLSKEILNEWRRL